MLRLRVPRTAPASPAEERAYGSFRVLIVSASMGAGHDGAARALAAQLDAGGHQAVHKDFLTSGPLRIGSALRRGYEFELKHMPSAYDATYRLWYRVPWLCPLVAWLVTLLTRRRVLRWVRECRADVVVSTYPLSTLCLGRLRTTGRLQVPAVNFITDFGVHPLWVHRGIDLNLTVHDGPARVASARTGRAAIACGPVVSPAFDPANLPGRSVARERLGIPLDANAVLVVAGSWGVGDVESTWRAIVQDRRFTPVVVCGRDQRLLTQVSLLARESGSEAVVLGWTDEMPALMAACDALVENAGGLTSLEAMRAGLPVVSFHPIAGHGKENAAGMAAAGVSRFAPDSPGLSEALLEATQPGEQRSRQIALAHSMFRADAADLILGRAAAGRAAVPEAARNRRPALVATKVAATLTGITALAWAGLTSGVAVATEQGAGVAHPVAGSDDLVYVGVRINQAELSDRAVAGALKAMNVTAVIDDYTARADPSGARLLVTDGVNVENGGIGDTLGHNDSDGAPWSRARRDARAGAQLAQIIHVPVNVTIPGRRLTAWDLIACSAAHTSLVVPNHILDASRMATGLLIRLTGRRIYLVNGLNATPAQLLAYLAQLRMSLQAANLYTSPFASLG